MYENVHIIGGGIAGLACAVVLKKQKNIPNITIYEASNHLGGRCFSPFIEKFGCEIDNGTHMFVKANSNIFKYLTFINNNDDVITKYPRIKNIFKHPIKLLNLAKESVFNTNPNDIRTFYLLKTMFKCLKNPQPCFVKNTLKNTFINPFLSFAKTNNIQVKYGYKCINFTKDIITFTKEKQILNPDKDLVIFALPLWALSYIFPFIPRFKYNPITNIHFMLPDANNDFSFIGKVAGYAHWYKVKDNILSVTISNSINYNIENIWNEAKQIFPFLKNYLSYQEFIEQRATLAQDRKNLIQCKKTLQELQKQKVLCIGDWTMTNIPNTIEAAISSGFSIINRI